MNRRFVLPFLALMSALITVVSCGEITPPVSLSRAVPAPILGNRVFTDLALGDFHSCGLTAGGEAFCWGVNAQGQSGNGLASDDGIGTPLIVLGGFVFTKLYAGGSHSCGILETGGSVCWGFNAAGQLGVGSYLTKFEPTTVSGEHIFTSLSLSTVFHSCGLKAAGSAWCWGDNDFGRLGDGTTTRRNEPTAVSGNLVFASISAGGAHNCGLTGDGTAYCWGLNSRGQLGDGTDQNRLVPTAVATALKFEQIVAGLAHTCALTLDDLAYCWGDNVGGALGDETTIEFRTTPARVAGLNQFNTIVVGERHTCGITIEGITLCWGFNNFGALGDGTFISRRAPVPLLTPIIFKKIAAGGYHTCGITPAGVTYCWGDNSGNQLGTAPGRD